jgi:DNA primase
MTDKTISTYKLGAFPSDLRDLYNRFDMDPVELREQDIIINVEYSPFKLYPIVIPVHDVTGKPIAIGCRTLLSSEKLKQLGLPKYRNSSYKKTSHLFGLNHAVDAIRNKDRVFIVEGYFDCITAQRCNFLNVVATCGTIFSERQMVILSRYTKNMCLLFDNDEPGRRNSQRVMEKFSDFDKDVNLTCAFTPDGYKDLDEYLRRGGAVSTIEQQIAE